MSKSENLKVSRLETGVFTDTASGITTILTKPKGMIIGIMTSWV